MADSLRSLLDRCVAVAKASALFSARRGCRGLRYIGVIGRVLRLQFNFAKASLAQVITYVGCSGARRSILDEVCICLFSSTPRGYSSLQCLGPPPRRRCACILPIVRRSKPAESEFPDWRQQCKLSTQTRLSQGFASLSEVFPGTCVQSLAVVSTELFAWTGRDGERSRDRWNWAC